VSVSRARGLPGGQVALRHWASVSMVMFHWETGIKPGNKITKFAVLSRLFPGLFPGFGLAVAGYPWLLLSHKLLIYQ
jgi:hypothetical protein